MPARRKWSYIFIILNLFYLRFYFGPNVCTGNFSVKICGVMPLPGSLRNTILHQPHTIFSHNFTNSIFFHTNHSPHTTVWLHRCHEPRLTKFCWLLLSLPTCAIISSISFTRRSRAFLHNTFLFRQGKRN